MHETFRRLCGRISDAIGSPWGFVIAFASLLAWAINGPIVHYWQLAITTSTTIVTFLVVFLIHENLVDLEDLDDAQLKQLQQEFSRMREVQ